MSFWAGVAQGFKDAEARRERDMDRASRQEEIEYNRNWQQRMFDYRQKQDEYAQNRQARLDEMAIEERDYNRKRQEEELHLARVTTFLPYLNNPAMAGALAGTGNSSSLGPMSPKAIAAGSEAFKLQFQDLTPEQRKTPFFQALSQSADGQAAVVAFMSAQAEEGNTIKMQDLPKYFKYLGATQGQGQEQAQEFLTSVMDGSADIKDTDTFIRGLVAMQQWKPVKHLFQQVDAPTSQSDLDAQHDNWKTAIVNEALRLHETLPEGDPRKSEILNAVTATENTATEMRGYNALVRDLKIGADLREQQGFGDNFLINGYYDQPQAAGGQPDPIVVEKDGLTTYSSFEEATAASQKEGFVNKFYVEGFGSQPISLNGFQSPTDTFVDFGDAATDTIQESVDGINAEPATVDSVIQDLTEAGINFPTNEQELDFFIQDVNEAIESFGMNLPQEVLDQVMDRAAQNALR